MANLVPQIEYGSPTTTITFELPPTGDNLNERNRANARTTISTGGVEQTQWNYNSQEITVNFTFLTQTLIDSLRTFFEDHASKGLEFTYFEDKDVPASANTYTLRQKDFSPKKLFPDDLGGHIWDLRLTMRRTL